MLQFFTIENKVCSRLIIYGLYCVEVGSFYAHFWRVLIIIDAFELGCWRRFWRVPWTARRSNQSILKEISTKYSLERLMLKLKLQYFGHLMGRTDSFENALMLGKIEGRRRRGWQRMKWLDGITNSMDMSLSKLWDLVMHQLGNVQTSLAWCSSWVPKNQMQMNHWPELSLSYMTTGKAIRNPCYSMWSAMRR